MSATSERTVLQHLSIGLGPAVAVFAAWLFSLPDDRVDAGVTLANVALAIAVITVAFAAVDWLAGVSTSIAAALSLNYFHTEPYRTLRITDRRDVYSVVLLAVLGLAVSAVTAVRVRRGVTAIRHDDARRAGDALAVLLAEDHPAPEAWSAAIGAASNDLGLIVARITQRAPAGLPVIGRRLVDGDEPTVLIPAAGAALPLRRRHPEGACLVLTPRADLGALVVDRRAVLSFADAIERALEPALVRHESPVVPD